MNTNIRVLGAKSRNEAAAQVNTTQEEDIDEKPRSVYEVITRQMLEQLKDDVREVKGRINTLLWMVISAMVVELVMRIVK